MLLVGMVGTLQDYLGGEWSITIIIFTLLKKQLMKELPRHWMKNFYYASFMLEKFKNTACVESLSTLLYFFGSSNYILNQIANAYYNNQEFEVS